MNAGTPEETALADAVEASGFVDLYAAAPAELRDALGLCAEVAHGVTLLAASAVPDPILNRVIG